MLFLEQWFWIFAAIAIPGYWLCPARWKLYWLLGASATFHWYFAGPAGMAPIIVLAVTTWASGLAIARGRTRLFAWTCVLLAGALGFYKYSEFALAQTSDALAWGGADALASRLAGWKAPAAPLAISFFTFEFVHYLYEVRRRGRAPVRSPVHFAVFAIFFPTLASGPIKRFPDFVPQLSSLERPRLEQVVEGGKRVIRGLFKKVCIADLLVQYIAVLEDAPVFTAPVVALLAVLQGFRIYYDFCGYSDMAIGLAQMLGLRVPENFDRPYLSTSLQDFWRRWHISLSTWIRDYIYVPLGGNRVRQLLNLLLAMALCGLWHGAAWNFVLWGTWHGAGLAAEAFLRRRRPALFEGGRLAALARWAVCYAFVTYGWLLFFYPVERVARMTRDALLWGLG
jgi:alginate O-acetyltransferase complex protein AlgI